MRNKPTIWSLIVCAVLAGGCPLQAYLASDNLWAWQQINNAGGSSTASMIANGSVSLSLPKAGEVSASTGSMPVTAGKQVAVTFTYTASGLSTNQPLELTLHWLDASGIDVDAPRLPLGFPRQARVWQFTRNDKNPVPVADNVTVPDRAAQARFTVRLAAEEMKGGAHTVDVSATVSPVSLKEGEVTVTGIDLPSSGPADAGPLSQPPDDIQFPANLVPNGALEDGTDVPTGWKIQGDNTTGAAEWIQGGAYSGKRAFKISDRGPYAASWDPKPGDPPLAGGKLSGNWAAAREEVSARWVSDPMPATAGTAYQTSAFYWYGSRVFLDQAVVNAVRIQFLDAQGKPLRPTTIWDDWFHDARAITETGWVFVPGKPLIAPKGTAFVRVVVALHHAFAEPGPNGTVNRRPSEHRFVLVDNISLYALPSNAPAQNNDEAFASAAAAHALPYVGTSPAHRPNSVLVQSKTALAAGLIVRPAGQDVSGALSLELTNVLGDERALSVSYDMVDITGKSIGEGSTKVSLAPFTVGTAAINLPTTIPYGPYLLSYKLEEGGSEDAISGQARFGIMPPRETSNAERGRMDYPFAFWMPGFTQPTTFDQQQQDTLGQLAQYGGMGKTWFGCSGMLYPDQFINIKDPAARHAAVDKRIADARTSIAIWRKYGVTPMGGIQNTQLPDPAQYPILAEVVKQYVGALKGDIHVWRHGTEAIHGGIKELDRATVDGRNGQGDSNYLYWGRKGTVRQYWAEYLVAHNAAKEADPTCIFGPQSASDIEGDVLRTFFQVMPNKDLDSFGMNTYISAFSIWPPNERELQLNGVPNLPIYVSEFAAQNSSPTAPDHLQKEYAASEREVTYWAAVLQSFPNLFHLEQWGMILGNDDGSLTYEGQVRPPYLAFATMTNQLGAGKFVAKYDLPGAQIYVRRHSVRDGYVAMVWATGGELPIDLDLGPDASAVDMWGNPVTLSIDQKVATVSASASPIYIASSTEIKPHMGVQISVDYAMPTPAQPRIAVTLKNATSAPAPGQLELVQNGPLQIADRVRPVASLAPGASTTLDFDVQPVAPLNGQRITVQARYTVGPKTYQFPAALNFNPAQRAAAPPVIDAKSWSDDELNEVADAADQVSLNGSPKAWGGPSDLSARAGARWDDQNLYLFFKVTDDVDMPPGADNEIWNHDSIEFYLDPARKLTGDAPYTMFGIARFPGGPKLVRADGSLPKGDVPGSQVAARRDGDLSLYEVAIPWDQIAPGFKPHEGQAIALAWIVNDFDGGDSGKRQLFWFTHEKDPSHFGDVVLTGPAGGKP